MLPLKPKYFASSHPCLDSEDDDRPDVWVLGLLGCFFQTFELAAFQSPVPRWLIALISDTGMRLLEACGLQACDIHLDGDTPYINLVE